MSCPGGDDVTDRSPDERVWRTIQRIQQAEREHKHGLTWPQDDGVSVGYASRRRLKDAYEYLLDGVFGGACHFVHLEHGMIRMYGEEPWEVDATYDEDTEEARVEMYHPDDGFHVEFEIYPAHGMVERVSASHDKPSAGGTANMTAGL